MYAEDLQHGRNAESGPKSNSCNDVYLKREIAFLNPSLNACQAFSVP